MEGTRKPKGFSGAERAAMRERQQELKAASARTDKADGGKANLDEGKMWSTAFALKELTTAEEAGIAALVRKAAG
jgi:hypothetical protein